MENDTKRRSSATLSELLEQLPEKGWIKLVRSPTNNYKWWCKYEAEEYKIK